MAAAADSSSSSTSNTHSPRFRRSSRGRGPARPRAEDPAPPARPEIGEEKKSAWNKPANGVVEVGAVMGAVAWPALSESARASPRSSSSDSLVGLSDGSGSAAAVLSEVSAMVDPVGKPNTSNHNPSLSSSSTNSSGLARQKSVKRGGGGGGGGSGSGNSNAAALVNGGTAPRSPAAVVETTQASLDRPVAAALSPRAPPNRNNGGWEQGNRPSGFSPQGHGGDHHRHGGNNRRGNNGGGNDGGHNNYGGRRNHERGNYEWNSHRNFNNRDGAVKQQPHHQRFAPAPFLVNPVSGAAPFIRPGVFSPVSGSPMGFPDMSAPMMYIPVSPQPVDPRVVPFVAPPVIFPGPDPQMTNLLLKQIEYYFSPENLCKDIYLRQKMEEQGGWVHVSVIANFNRVKQYTNNIRFILDTVRASALVEVQGEKLRKRGDWKNWILPSPANNPNSPSTGESSTPLTHDVLAARLTGIGLEAGSSSQASFRMAPATALTDSRSSGELKNQSQAPGNSFGDGIGENLPN